MTLAGFPTTIVWAGTSFTTTAPAPIIVPSPMVISPIIHTLGPIVTLSSMIGDFSAPSNPLAPIVVFWRKLTLLPMIVPGLTTLAWAEWKILNPVPILVDGFMSHPNTNWVYRPYKQRQNALPRWAFW